MVIRTRFAPSPTGYLHLGGVRTALFNYLFAKKSGGSIILRIEDTDKKRSEKKYETNIIEDLEWLGLTFDEGVDIDDSDLGPYRQSERSDIYKKHVDKLLASGDAYKCYCTKERLDKLKTSQIKAKKPPRYDGKCRELDHEMGTGTRGNIPESAKFAVRFKSKKRTIKFKDMVHGNMFFESTSFGDFVILTTEGNPIYSLSVVVDDALMKISHVIRGDDHLSNTARQIQIYEALKFDVPTYGHIPLVTGPTGAPLSKRDKGFTAQELKESGYLPLGILNGLARLGWDGGNNLLEMEEMIEKFDISKVSKSPSKFDIEIIKNYNKQAIVADSSIEYLIKAIRGDFKTVEGNRLPKLIKEVKANSSTIEELKELILPFTDQFKLETSITKGLKEKSPQMVISALKEAVKDTTTNLSDVVNIVKDRTSLKGKELFMPIRLALTGSSHGIELPRVLNLLGRDEILKRLESL